MNENTHGVFVSLFILLFFVVLLGVLYLEKKDKNTLAIEALKAGLVQDKEGHWVKP